MHSRSATVLVAALLSLAPLASQAAPPLADYTQNFEAMSKSSPTALSADGWFVYGNVFSATNVYLYGYGPYPAPNSAAPSVPVAFSALDTLQGGVDQGNLQLSVFSDYNNTGAHGNGQLVESNFYHEQTVTAGDVGKIYTFQFDAKHGDWSAALYNPSAVAFIKTLNPAAGYALTNFITANMTIAPAVWNTYKLSITIDASLVGQLIQFGFANTSTRFDPTGVYYDNIVWSNTQGVGVGTPRASTLQLRAATPNPFRTTTRVDFTMAQRGTAQLGVFDITGRRVATLFDGVADAGPHAVSWDGRFADGRLAPSGVYQCVLQTGAERQARKLVLSR
jgi:hypothetical protein